MAVGEMADQPRGTLRLNVTSAADSFLSGATLGGFLERYPEVRLEITVGNRLPDIVAGGYDAGVRLGEVIAQDMITVPVSERLRLIVVGAGILRAPSGPRAPARPPRARVPQLAGGLGPGTLRLGVHGERPRLRRGLRSAGPHQRPGP